MSNDQINPEISDIGLNILKIIRDYPGINVPEIITKLQEMDILVNVDKVRNELKRSLSIYVEHRGSNKNGGYYLKHLYNK